MISLKTDKITIIYQKYNNLSLTPLNKSLFTRGVNDGYYYFPIGLITNP